MKNINKVLNTEISLEGIFFAEWKLFESVKYPSKTRKNTRLCAPKIQYFTFLLHLGLPPLDVKRLIRIGEGTTESTS